LWLNSVGENMRSRLFIIFLITTVLVLFVGCRTNIEKGRNFIQPIPFEKEKWSDDRGIGVEALWEIRPALARDLINKGKLIGKSREEVIEMLGDEGNTFGFPNMQSYQLEQIQGFAYPIAIEFLQITFNTENKVEKAEIEFHKTGDWRE
jgi:hypothetical protein